MWSRITSVLKSRVEDDDATEQEQATTSHLDLTLRMEDLQPSPSSPGSPSRTRSVLKRLSKLQIKDSDSVRAPSPSPNGQHKVRNSLFNPKFGTTSQLSLGHSPADMMGDSPPELSRRSSQDMLRAPPGDSDQSDTTKKGINIFKRPSLDILRSKQRPVSQVSGQSSQDESPDGTPATPNAEFRFGSVRSILRNPKTPGSGQNVRFFSRDAYKVISPEHSAEAPGGDFHSMANDTQTPSPGQRPAGEASYYMTPEEKENSPMMRSTNSRFLRPTATEVFSSMTKDATIQARPSSSVSTLPHADFDDNSFDMSSNFNMPRGPPGLGFDVREPSMDMSLTDRDETAQNAAVTSTPFRDNKGKGRAMEVDYDVEHDIHSTSVVEVETMLTEADDSDDATFRGPRVSQPTPPRAQSPALQDRSHSSSFGQSMFHSVAQDSPSANTSIDSNNRTELFNTAVDLKPSPSNRDIKRESASPSFGSISRSRAISDSIFHSAFRSPPTTTQVETNNPTTPSSPEGPDPFSANAKTYYTPQTMIPVTPPSGKVARVRRTSKEESMIISLQTQLALQTELCGQYETDLRAKDELVEILSKKVGEFEKEDAKRRNLLRSWKKKVQELERTCRYLEEEVEGSKRDSMERSIMDEASDQALKMLHTQIAALEKEKKEWKREEESLRIDLAKAEETLRDNEEQRSSVVQEDRSLQEKEWEGERAELLKRLEEMTTEQMSLQSSLAETKQQLDATTKDHDVLKAELNAQWEHTEKASEKIGDLQRKTTELRKERDALELDLKELIPKASNITGIDERRLELESEVQELWNQKEDLEKEKQQLDEDLRHERNQIEELSCILQERDERISELTQDLEFTHERIAQMEAHLQERETELENRSRAFEDGERELRTLRNEVNHLQDELARVSDEDARADRSRSSRESEMRDQLDELANRHASAEAELRRHKDKMVSLETEIQRSKAQIQELQKENANKDVKLLQAAKKREEDRADLAGMNMALDAKQQELELIKRKLGLKGTGGSIPTSATATASRSRRESSVLNTPSIIASRPSSSLSNASSTVTKRKTSLSTTGTSERLAALATSARANGVRSPTSTSTSSKRPESSIDTAPKTRLTTTGRAISVSRASRPASISRSPQSDLETNSSDQERTVRRVPARAPRQSLTSPTAPRNTTSSEKENVDLTARRQLSGPIPA